MEYKNIFGFEIRWNVKTVILFMLLLLLPNYIGMFQYTTIFGLRIHFFQIMIFLAAMIYGPLGGALSGAVGSVYVAMALHNPYVVVGNIILGLFTGIFYRKGLHLIIAAFLAYLIQMPWLYVTDVYLANMPVPLVQIIVVSLLVSDLLWAAIANFVGKKTKNFL